MESLTQEQDKLVQMRIVKYTKDQYLTEGVSNQINGMNTPKDSKQQENKKKEKYKYSDASSNPRKDKWKKQDKTKCSYCHKGW